MTFHVSCDDVATTVGWYVSLRSQVCGVGPARLNKFPNIVIGYEVRAFFLWVLDPLPM